MLHVDLGCSVEGCNGYGDTGADGTGMPGQQLISIRVVYRWTCAALLSFS